MESKRNKIDSLYKEILQEILLFLDLKSIIRLCSTSTGLYSVLNSNSLWKELSIRDFRYFLVGDPINDDEFEHPKSMKEVEEIKEDEMEANKVITNPFDEPLTDLDQQALRNNIAKVSDWKEFYISHKKLPDLTGFFVGDYGAHGYEFIRIYHKGYKIFAKKLTGDANVPAGKLTWKATLDKSLTKAKGYIHLASTGFKDPRWSKCLVEVPDENTFIISWYPCKYMHNFLLCMEFFNIRCGVDQPKNDDELRKTYLIPLEDE